MDIIKKVFPYSFKVKEKDVSSLVVSLIIYIVVGFVAGLIIGFLAQVPVLGYLFSVIGSVIGLYTFLGIVLAVLNFFNLLK